MSMPSDTKKTSVGSGMLCTVCQGQKYTLRPRKSKLIETLQLLLCDACFTAKREPRWAIILVARAQGVDAVADYVKHERYIGDPILLDELVD